MKPISDNMSNFQAFTPEKVSVSAARSNFSELLQALGEEPSKVYEVDKFDMPLALLLSFEVYNPIVQALREGDLVPILANLVMNKWFDMARVPSHIAKPQLTELLSMGQSSLLILFQTEPCDSIELLKDYSELDVTLTERLIKRRTIVQAIHKAESDGLYEVSEHLSSTN